MADQSQGMEYTLQGVMRFLQIEWHNHERARNAWDIERGEMKARIAKQEGDSRSAKKLNESLDRQIRMLEKVLKQERAKNKAVALGNELSAEEDVKKKWNGKMGINPSTASQKSGKLEPQALESRRLEQDPHKDHARVFCQKNVEELTYLIAPSTSLAPQLEPQQLQNSAYGNQQDPQPTIEEAYLQQQHHQQQINQQPNQQQQQQRRIQQPGLSHLPSMPNHHPPPNRTTPDYYYSPHPPPPPQQPPVISRQSPNQQSLPPGRSSLPLNDGPPPLSISRARDDDQVETVSHSFDNFGSPIEIREEQIGMSRQPMDDPDGWDFDDTSTVIEARSDSPPPRISETDLFPSTHSLPAKSPPRTSPSQRRRSSGSLNMSRRRSDGSHELRDLTAGARTDPAPFKVRFALRGHLDVVRSIIFTGGGSPSEPEICTTGDDGTIKRWILPSSYGNFAPGQQQQQHGPAPDLDIQSYFTHRGHDGIVTCLAACPASPSFSTGGRALGDGWVFSGGQDATVRVWERGRVDPKATLHGHTDAIWALCVLSSNSATIFGSPSPTLPSDDRTPLAGLASSDRILLASGSADRTLKIWAVSAPPQLNSPQNAPGGSTRRGVGGSRRHSITSGSGFPSSPQPSTASGTPFFQTLVHSLELPGRASPTSIAPLGTGGENFAVSFADSSIIIFDTRTGEEVVGMASAETYDGTPATGINAVVVTSSGVGGASMGDGGGGSGGLEGEEEEVMHGATGSSKGGGVEGVVISGHEDRFVRFFDANSGQCTYSMLAHPSSIASLSLSPDGRELVSAGHDASLRFWSLEKRSCVQEISTFRVMRGEGVVCVVWSSDGRWVVAGGGDGGVRVFGR